MKHRAPSLAAVCLLFVVAACGDSTGSGGTGTGGDAAGGAGELGGAAEGGAGGAGGAGGSLALPDAPILDEVAPMHGGLHVFWTNVALDCDAVEGEHKTSTTEFVNFFSVPGTIDNEMDDIATDAAETYTYRVRCKRGEVYSAYSNEISNSPE